MSCEPVPEGTTVVVPLPKWELGSGHALEVDIIEARSDFDGASTTPVELEVVGETDQGWTLIWWYETTAVNDVQLPPDEAIRLEQLMAEIPKLRLEYELDQDRGFTGLANLDEVRETTIATLEALQKVLGNEISFEAALSLYDRMSDEKLELSVAEDLLIFHAFENLVLPVGQAVEFAESLPNMLGGEPFPAVTTMRIAELVDEDGCVLIEALTILDPDRIGPILTATLPLTFPDLTGAQLIEFSETFTVENRITAQYDYGSTFFREVSVTQTISMGSETQFKTRTITDVTP